MSKDLIAGTIPGGALALHVILLGKTRSGKSSKMRLIVEHCLERGQPVGIIDPKGDWWGIKLAASGKSAGFPVVIFGGEHADVKINEHSGAQVAELVATENRPFLIDLGGWMPAKRTRFFVDFASTFFIKTRGKRVLAIDEVHNFAPQGRVDDPQAAKALHWANRLASEGGGKGITLISASQRPQKVHKDYVTSHETLIACKVIHKLDRDAVKDWIDGCGDPEQGREVFKTLGNLQKPQAWAWCPEIGFGPRLVTFPMFKTYDSFKPQEVGDAAKLKGWATVDLQVVNEKLAAVIAEEAAKDPVALRAQVAALTKANADLEARLAAAPAAPDKGTIAEAEQRGFDRAKAKLEKASATAAKKIVAEHLAEFQDKAAGLLNQIEKLHRGFADELTATVKAARAEAPEIVVANDPVPQPAPTVPPRPLARANAVTPFASTPPVQTDGERKIGAERRPLAALVAVYPAGMTEAQWAVAAGLKRTGGTWSTYVSRLRTGAYIETRGDQFYATAAGIQAAGTNVQPVPPPGPQRVEFWARKLAGVRPMLSYLMNAYPHYTSRQDLAEGINLAASGGTFSTYLSRLRSPGLIEENGSSLRLSADVMG